MCFVIDFDDKRKNCCFLKVNKLYFMLIRNIYTKKLNIFVVVLKILSIFVVELQFKVK